MLAVADLSDAARLARVGLGPPTPGRRSWPSYEAVSELLWRESWAGLIVPSAARPEGFVLCLFSTDAASLPAEPVPPPTTVAEPPAPPTGLRT